MPARPNQTVERRRREARLQVIRDGLARGESLTEIHANHRSLWPDSGNGQRTWRRDRAAVVPESVVAVAAPAVVLLPSVPCARTMHSTLLDPLLPLEMPGERNARLWDGRAGTTPIVPPSEIRNAATLASAGGLGRTGRRDLIEALVARRVS